MNNVSFLPLFATPVMQVELDFDLEKFSEFAFQMQNKDKKGGQVSNRGGWQSDNIIKEEHKEFIRLKEKINQHLQEYCSQIFRGMVFKKNVVINLGNMWININEKHHYNEWHIHPLSTLSGVYYIKHDGSRENGDILFKHPKSLYLTNSHFPPGIIEKTNEITSGVMEVLPISNMLLIFPSWLEHKAEINFKDDTRISLSFNSFPLLEKKS